MQRNLKISSDSRLSYKILKRLTGGAGLNTEVDEVLGAEECCWHDPQRDLQRADRPSSFYFSLFHLFTHKGCGKKFSNHFTINDLLSGMAALADVLGIKDDNKRVIHAYHMPTRHSCISYDIADGPYSTESSKKHPFSLRAAFTAKKVRLEEEVLTQTSRIRIHPHMIGNISCSGGGGSVSANEAASAKSTPKTGRRQTRHTSCNRAPVARRGLSTSSRSCRLKMCN